MSPARVLAWLDAPENGWLIAVVILGAFLALSVWSRRVEAHHRRQALAEATDKLEPSYWVSAKPRPIRLSSVGFYLSDSGIQRMLPDGQRLEFEALTEDPDVAIALLLEHVGKCSKRP